MFEKNVYKYSKFERYETNCEADLDVDNQKSIIVAIVVGISRNRYLWGY